MNSFMTMNFTSYAEMRQIRLGLPGDYEDVTNDLDPLPIYVSNIPKSASQSDVAEIMPLPDDCVTLEVLPRNKRSNVAHVQPRTWDDSDYMLGDESTMHVCSGKLKGRTLFFKEAYDRDNSVPSHKSYKIPTLSEEDFDLSPACVEKPSIHCLNDDVLMHILGYLDLKEKLRIEAVCRRWQALIHTMVGRQSTVDLNADDCIWRPVLPAGSKAVRNISGGSAVEGRLRKYKLIMYKMLILNGDHLTTLHLDENRCYVDINVVAAIGRLAPNLEVLSLRFSRSRHHFTSLRVIFSKCLKLKTFCLDNIATTKHLFNDLRCCKSLEVLRLRSVKQLSIKGKLKLPLKELSISDVDELKLKLEDLLQPMLRTFRMFHTFEMDDDPADLSHGMLDTLLATCPDLVELQVCYPRTWPRFQSFGNLKILHLQVYSFKSMEDQLRMDLPAVEDLRIELSKLAIDEELQRKDEYSFDFSRCLPSSLKSLTLPTLTFTDTSYESLLTLPNLERVFFKSKSFSVALLKKFVSRVQMKEISAGMLHLEPRTLEELASLRRKALAKAGENAPSSDPPRPLVLHLKRSKDGEVKFRDPLLKIIEMRGEAYLYDRVGTSHFDNEWVDFGVDFMQHELGQPYPESDYSDNSGDDFLDHHSYFSDHSYDHDRYIPYWVSQDSLDSDNVECLDYEGYADYDGYADYYHGY